MKHKVLFALLTAHTACTCHSADDIMVECEQFADKGGWTIDSQFIDEMGSAYLLAHGVGKPVADAKTRVAVHEDGEYSVFVRMKNWDAHWSDSPAGVFSVAVDGVELPYKAAMAWLKEKRHRGTWRFDVIEVYGTPETGLFRIDHIKRVRFSHRRADF